MSINEPGLFGLNKSNRDFKLKKAWGKNQFNSSFPASLCCYLYSKKIKANYLAIEQSEFKVLDISIREVFGINPDSDDIYFAFESPYTPFQKYVIGALPRTDLVIQGGFDQCLVGLEVKLTALPDNTTCELDDSQYGSEIVVRPDTIVYLACSIAKSIGYKLNKLLPDVDINDWSEADQVLDKIDIIVDTIEKISEYLEKYQIPFLLQPVWKTKGKSPELAENCLDVFVWSDAGFVNFISKISSRNIAANKITRQTRTAIWLFKMLLDFSAEGKFNHELIIDSLSYNTKNDKAFAASGNVTNEYMKCTRLTNPKIGKSDIKNIILGGGQDLLSPERRFDAILFNSPELFRK